MPGKTPRLLIISHWHKLFENFNYSSQEFYSSLERVIQKREVPDLEISRVDWLEGGLLSTNREDLRLTRERLVFDICAAPFGTGYFFSYRLGETPLSINILHVLILLLLSGAVMQPLSSRFGILLAPIYFVGGLVLIFFLLRQAAQGGLAGFDSFLMKAPVFGTIYEKYFRPLTYYRLDLIQAYHSAVHAALMEAIDEVTKAKGMRPLSEEERKPVMKDLYWKKK